MSYQRFETSFTDETQETDQEALLSTPNRIKRIQHFDLLLVGKSGHGKSHSGNTILGRPVFKVSASMTSVTNTVEYEVCAYKNYIFKVVDTPGVKDTAEIANPVKASQIIIEQMASAVTLNPEGYHAFLLVVKLGGRFTKEEQDCIRILKHIFGENFVKNYCILIVTGGDQFYKQNNGASFKEWRKTQTGVFKTLVDECGDRVVLFDNKTQEPNTRDKQLAKLLKSLGKLPNIGERYKDHHFQEAEISRQKLIKETRDVFISDDLNEISLILQKIAPIPTFDEEKRDKKIDKLVARIEYLICQIRQDKDMVENKQTVINLIADIRDSIQNFKKDMNRLIKSQKENDCNMDKEALSISDTMAKFIATRASLKEVEEIAEKQIKDLSEQISALRKESRNEIEKIRLESKEKTLTIRETIKEKANEFDYLISKHQKNPQERINLEKQKEMCLKKLSSDFQEIDKLVTSKRMEFEDKIEQCKKEKKEVKAQIKSEKEKERTVKDLLVQQFGGNTVIMRKIMLEEIKLRKSKGDLEKELQVKVERNRKQYILMKDKAIKVLNENVKKCSIM